MNRSSQPYYIWGLQYYAYVAALDVTGGAVRWERVSVPSRYDAVEIGYVTTRHVDW